MRYKLFLKKLYSSYTEKKIGFHCLRKLKNLKKITEKHYIKIFWFELSKPLVTAIIWSEVIIFLTFKYVCALNEYRKF